MTTHAAPRRQPRPTQRPRTARLPASFIQEDMLRGRIRLINPGLCWRLRGQLDKNALRAALDYLAERHEALRTTFHESGGVYWQRISPKIAISIRFIDDLSYQPAGEEMAVAALHADSLVDFDTAIGPMLRCTLVRLANDEHLLSLVFPHIVMDKRSLAIVNDELWMAYVAFELGQTPQLEPLALQYADIAAAEREFWQNIDISKSELDFDNLYPTDLCPPFAMAALTATRPSRQRVLSLEPGLAKPLRAALDSVGASMAAGFVALQAASMHYYTGNPQVYVHPVLHNRRWPELDSIVGPCFKTARLRLEIGPGLTLAALSAQAMTALSSAYRKDLPATQVYGAGSPGAILNFFHNPASPPPERPARLEIEPLDIGAPPAYDHPLLQVDDDGEACRLTYRYDPTCFSEPRVDLMLAHLLHTLALIAEQPLLSLDAYVRECDSAGFAALRIPAAPGS